MSAWGRLWSLWAHEAGAHAWLWGRGVGDTQAEVSEDPKAGAQRTTDGSPWCARWPWACDYTSGLGCSLGTGDDNSCRGWRRWDEVCEVQSVAGAGHGRRVCTSHWAPLHGDSRVWAQGQASVLRRRQHLLQMTSCPFLPDGKPTPGPMLPFLLSLPAINVLQNIPLKLKMGSCPSCLLCGTHFTDGEVEAQKDPLDNGKGKVERIETSRQRARLQIPGPTQGLGDSFLAFPTPHILLNVCSCHIQLWGQESGCTGDGLGSGVRVVSWEDVRTLSRDREQLGSCAVQDTLDYL